MVLACRRHKTASCDLVSNAALQCATGMFSCCGAKIASVGEAVCHLAVHLTTKSSAKDLQMANLCFASQQLLKRFPSPLLTS